MSNLQQMQWRTQCDKWPEARRLEPEWLWVMVTNHNCRARSRLAALLRASSTGMWRSWSSVRRCATNAGNGSEKDLARAARHSPGPEVADGAANGAYTIDGGCDTSRPRQWPPGV